MGRRKQRGEADVRGESLPRRESREGNVQGKREESGEADLGGGEPAGWVRSSLFPKGTRASEGLPWGKKTESCPLPCSSTLSHPPGCSLQGHGMTHCKVVSGPGQGCW